MKKLLASVAGFVVLAAILGGCAAGRYDDYRALLRQELRLMKAFNAAAEQAADAPALKAAIRQLSEGLIGLSAGVKNMEESHPDLASLSQPPAELQTEFDELGKALSGLDRVLIMKGPLLEDPDLIAELERLIELQAELGL